MSKACVHGYVSGRVQGVWFRGFVREQAQRFQLHGWAKNLPDGRVEVFLCGERDQLDQAVEQLHTGPPLSRVDRVEIRIGDYDSSERGFRVL